MFVGAYKALYLETGNSTNSELHPNVSKALIALGLLAATLFAAAIPVALLFCHKIIGHLPNERNIIQKTLTGLSCLGGGVFLATCFLHLIPEGTEKMEDALKAVGADIDLPLPFVIVLAGFLLVLILEELMHYWTAVGHGHSHSLPPVELGYDGVDVHSSDEDDNEVSLQDEDMTGHSPFRAIIMIFALSLHSIFEGIAIGLQGTTAEALELFGAIIVHKTVIAVTLSIALINSATRLTPIVIICCLGVFSAMSPIGILMGIGLDSAPAMVNGVMQCVAAGTFVYITFFEILPHELDARNREFSRVLKIILLLVGILLMIGIRLIFPDRD